VIDLATLRFALLGLTGCTGLRVECAVEPGVMMRGRQTTLHVLRMLAVVPLAVDLAAQSPAPPHIQHLAGCFHVSYRFVEDGTHDYEIKDALE